MHKSTSYNIRLVIEFVSYSAKKKNLSLSLKLVHISKMAFVKWIMIYRVKKKKNSNEYNRVKQK